MLTIRFNHHDGDGYKTYACRAYRVSNEETEAKVVMEFADGEQHEIQVGDNTPFGIAYVTNGDSRTIDVIRGNLSA
jgi:hypothetical protein